MDERRIDEHAFFFFFFFLKDVLPLSYPLESQDNII